MGPSSGINSGFKCLLGVLRGELTLDLIVSQGFGGFTRRGYCFCLCFPKTPGGFGFLFSLSFPRGSVHKKTCRGPGKPFSEENASTASCRRAADGDGWGAVGAERSRENVVVDGDGWGALSRAFAGGRGRGRELWVHRVARWLEMRTARKDRKPCSGSKLSLTPKERFGFWVTKQSSGGLLCPEHGKI